MVVSILIDNRLRIALDALPEVVVDELKARCTYDNPARRKLEQMVRGASGKKRAAMAYALKKEPAEVRTWEEAGGVLSLPRGALAKVRAVLTAHGLGWRYEDRRVLGDPGLGMHYRWGAPPHHKPDPRADDGGALRWYQVEAVEACRARQNCLLRAPTGSGKTSTLIGFIAAVGLPTLVVIDSVELMRQWTMRLVAELGLDEGDIGIIAGGVCRLAPITLATRQSLLSRATTLSRTFGVVIVDEVHRAAATTFMSVVDAFAARYRIGASADETRKDGKEFLVYDVFGEVAHEVTREELIEAGAVLDVECRVIPTDFRADWYVHQRETTGSPDFNRLLDRMVADVGRNALVVEAARAELDAGEQVLVLSQRVEHAAALAKTLGAGLMLGGEERRAEREKAIDDMRTGALRAAAGTIQAMGQAIDLPSVGRGILATPVGSNRQLYGQIRGRLCRPQAGKTAVIYVLWDQHVSGAAPLKRMLEWNRSVLVRDGTEWTNGRVYLKRWKEQHHGS